MELSKTVEIMTGSMQIEESDSRTRKAFSYQLDLWSRIVQADIIIVNNEGRSPKRSIRM
jgi:hypothetical protein